MDRKPRVCVTFTEGQFAQLDALCQAGGVSRPEYIKRATLAWMAGCKTPDDRTVGDLCAMLARVPAVGAGPLEERFRKPVAGGRRA